MKAAAKLKHSLRHPPGEDAKHRSSKDKKRWCKGVPGREHEYRYEAERRHAGWRLDKGQVQSILVCQKCRRESSFGNGWLYPRWVWHPWVKPICNVWSMSNTKLGGWTLGPAF